MMRTPRKNSAERAKIDDSVSVYVNFLERSRQLSEAPGAVQLEPFERRVLNELARLWAHEEPVTVLEAMRVDVGISSTTVHRKLKSLRRKGLVGLLENDIDNRIKHVVPTDAARRHFADLGRCVIEAAR